MSIPKIFPNHGSDKEISGINEIKIINGQNRCNQKLIGVIPKNKSEIEHSKSEIKRGRCLRPGFTLQVLALPALYPNARCGLSAAILTRTPHQNSFK
ncbi:hypothetical protein HYN43_024260 [Mucilaginibacter celer]|uniref:Uncharacterized protein n=1 Tax=Mucilaginibacter celer TaxID=2305508 RepID=A0A494W3X0_9SPHI|nr:hypothetical protein HYN43_024260 [Mucilaginibacter celer]